MSHSKRSEHFQFLFKGKQAPSLQELPLGRGEGSAPSLPGDSLCTSTWPSTQGMIPLEEGGMQHVSTPGQLSHILLSPTSFLPTRQKDALLSPARASFRHPDHPQPRGAVIFFFPFKRQRATFLFPSLRAENPKLLDNPILCNVNYCQCPLRERK